MCLPGAGEGCVSRILCKGRMVAGLLFVAVLQVQAADYHVALSGCDANRGSRAEPFATIQAGVSRLEAGDTLHVHGGTYRETVMFPRSGTRDKPITVRSYRKEKVTISGCDLVSGWVRHTNNIWKAAMPWTLGLGRNQVFSGDTVMIEARHPNVQAPGLEMYVAGLSPLWPTFGEFSIPKETRKEQPGRIVSKLLEGQPDNYWQGAIYYGVHFEGWSAQTGVIESSKPGEIMVGDRTKGWWFASDYPDEGRGMIIGHMHALDQPGEWHWQDNTLYFIPPGDEAPTAVDAKRRQLALDLSGREHIRVEGLHVSAASAKLEESRNCIFEDCHFSCLSHYTRHYGVGEIEHGRDTIKSGETGVYVSGRDNSFLSCSLRISAGAGFHLRGYHHTIHNCLIDEVSYVGHYLNAITDAVYDYPNYEKMLCGGHVITFNTMRNAGRHFFNFNGNGTSKSSRDRGPTDYMATLFAHNHLYNGMLQTRDAGFITGYYCSGGSLNELNSQVIYNVMHDNYDIAAMRWNLLGMVYLDAGTCNVDLHHNLLWAAPGSLQHGMWFNTVCVDIREHDNVFHPEFTRTCAELTAADFPGGRPFRFGHDFEHPPLKPQWPPLVSRKLEAQGKASELRDGDVVELGTVEPGWKSAVLSMAGTAQVMNTDRSARAMPRHRFATDPLVLEAVTNDGMQAGIRMQWSFVYSVTNGAWLRFNRVQLGDGYRRFRAVYGSSNEVPRRVEVHLDSVDGQLAGEVLLPKTDQPRKGQIQIYGEAVGELSDKAIGTHDVFLVFRSDDGQKVGAFEYFRFEQYRGAIPLQKNEVKLELRVGSRDGAKIGEFYPRFTGGAGVFKDFVTSLEPLREARPLFLVVRSALAQPAGAIGGFALQKCAEPVDRSGVGVKPRRRLLGLGGADYPEPTNRPQARPNDLYMKPVTKKGK